MRRSVDGSSVSTLLRTSAVMILAAAGLFSIACEPPNQPANRPVSNVNAASPATNSAIETKSPAQPSSTASQVAVTLPLVDALMQDQTFVNDAKSSLQINDEQIQKLNDTAHDDVLHLDETDQDSARSTRAATKKADDKIKQILGAEKGEQFINFVRERGAGINPDTVLVPNSIPSDSRIVVNAPAFRMDVFKNGKLTKSYRVGIGYPEFPLPTGLRKAEKIIFNPPWTPPDSPWVKGKFAPGKKVEAGSKDNPLGVLKIPIGLPSLIHGGKQPGRLGNFASHGCVGLTNELVRPFALELADLAGTPLSADQMKGYEKDRTETKEVALQNPIPVELRYETIVVQNGKLIVYRDVYEKGTNTEENLRKVLDAAGVPFETFSPDDQQKMLQALQSMAVDAQGHPVEDIADQKKPDKKNTHETKNVKGSKEITIQLPQLAGKGYPDPVNLAG